MARVADAGGGRDVAERPGAQVFEEMVPVPHGRHEEIGIAVVVDIGKRAPDGDLVRHRYTGIARDVDELVVARVAPELVCPELRQEVEVGTTVAIDVGCADAAAMIVVDELVVLARVIHDPVLERDTAFAAPVGEMEIVRNARRGEGRGFCASPFFQPHRRP